MHKRAISLMSFAVLALAGLAPPAAANGPSTSAPDPGYRVRRLVSDEAGKARVTDPNLVNAWGLAAGPATPWWVADNETNVSTIYDGAGAMQPLVVSVDGAPTGLVFNGGPNFVVSDGTNSGPSLFLFDTEGGTIRGWNPGVPPPSPSTQSFVVADRSGVGAIYKGLAIASTAGGDFLYAADFHNARVDVFDQGFNLVSTSSTFVDATIPAGFAPFGIQNIGGSIFVTYAQQDADAEDDVTGRGLGFVDEFDTAGNLLGRVASRGRLDAPWGLAMAPSDFGDKSGDLLVGNFGDGKILAFTPMPDGTFVRDDVLRTRRGKRIHIDGLWALEFANGGPSGTPNTLFFTAGPDDEEHGLFGTIEAVA